jgi:hypothetical protein
MTTATLDALDETTRIDALLDELAPLDTSGLPLMPRFPTAVLPPSTLLPRWSPGQLPTGVFLAGVNWANAADYDPPRPEWAAPTEDPEEPGLPTESVPVCPGAVGLRQFLGLVNWENRDEAPALPTFEAPAAARAAAGGLIVEQFFAQFAFE